MEKNFVKIVTSLVTVILKMTLFMYLLCVYKKRIILSLFKTDTLNFIMYILTI